MGNCAGWDKNSHPAFIWKRINGQKYCKVCSYKIEKKSTTINKVSEKQKEILKKKKENTILLHNIMYEWWKLFRDRKQCWNCSQILPTEFSTINVHHLLPKSKYKNVDKCTDYFYLICQKCHSEFETSPDNVKHASIYEATKKAKDVYNIKKE